LEAKNLARLMHLAYKIGDLTLDLIMKKTFVWLSLMFLFTAQTFAEVTPEDFSIEAKSKSKKKKKENAAAPFKFKESQLAHQLLDGKRGIEIGASIHNQFGLKTLNVDYTDDITTAFKQEEMKIYGEYLKVDIVSPGDDLPFKDNVWDFVINSHVIEHFYDPVQTIKEWLRVVKPGGLVYMIVPHKERTFDKDRPRTTLAEIIQNHDFPNPPVPDHHGHYSVWITQDFIDICDHYQWPVVAVQDVDDKVGNGFTVVIQKP
jgi:SAM-dependent methyltransferase